MFVEHAAITRLFINICWPFSLRFWLFCLMHNTGVIAVAMPTFSCCLWNTQHHLRRNIWGIFIIFYIPWFHPVYVSLYLCTTAHVSIWVYLTVSVYMFLWECIFACTYLFACIYVLVCRLSQVFEQNIVMGGWWSRSGIDLSGPGYLYH